MDTTSRGPHCMTKEEIFEVIKRNTVKVLINIDPGHIMLEKTLKEVGANSMDRAEIAHYSMEELNLKVPAAELWGGKNIADLVDLFHGKMNE